MPRFLLLTVLLLRSLLMAETGSQQLSSALTEGEHSVEINGVCLWYTVVGSGPVLVVQAPGWGAGSSYLRNGLAPLARHFTLIFYDPRGSGRSAHPDQNHMSPSDVINDLEQLRNHWGLKSMRLIGHSDGGSLALGYAIRYPDHVSRLILVDSSIYGCQECTEDVKKNVNARRTDKRFVEAIKALEDQTPGTTDEQFEVYLNRILPLYFNQPGKYLPIFQKTFSELPSSFAASTYYAGNNKASVKEIGLMDRVKAPTLILVGRNDFICSPVIAEKLQSGIRGSKEVIFDNTGHFPWIEDPKEFFNEVVHFAAKDPVQ